MYRYQARKLVLLLGVMALIGVDASVFGVNFIDELASKFQQYYNEGYSNSYLENAYQSEFSKDPFGDAMENVEGMSMNVKIAGVESIEDALSTYNCSMDQKKLWAIVYHFSPEYRPELARSLKISKGDYSSEDYMFDEDQILEYCREYYNCVNKKTDSSTDKITSSTPRDIISNCQEFMVQHYNAGSTNRDMLQNVEKSQLGFDKYRNATKDDSPYDIMYDISVVGTLLYDSAESAITPVMYHLPVFGKSQKSLNDAKNGKNGGSSSSSSSNGGSQGGGAKNDNSDKKSNDNSQKSDGSASLSDIGEDKTPIADSPAVKSTDPQSNRGGAGMGMEGGYDDMVDGLGSLKLGKSNGMFYGSLCVDDEEEEVEGEEIEPQGKTETLGKINSNSEESDRRGLSEQEFQEAVDFMLNAVDKYDALSDEDKEKIVQKTGGSSNKTKTTTPSADASDLENLAKEIKTCWQGCDDIEPKLRFDQIASCKLMCACGEVNSPIFDPNVTPGLGPIYMIRFCTVPGVNHEFSPGGKKVMSVEEMLKEIFGVLDKLSREGRLGTWTQQYNFLDSSTKNINFSDAVSFTVSVSREDVFNKPSKESKQFSDKVAEKENAAWQYDFGIANPVHDVAVKNKYRVIGYAGESVNDYSAAANPDVNREANEATSVAASSTVDQGSVSRTDRYLQIAQDLDTRLDRQGDFWKEVTEFTEEWRKYAEALYAKK